MVRAIKYQKIIIIIACGFFFLTDCRDFNPIKESDQYNFSINGYLDASADTQWVRVNPARKQIIFPPVKPEMTIMLEELESGNSVVMNDSLFQLANGINFVNVWTTMDIKPEHTYRLTARQPNGRSSVTVSIPSTFPVPTLRFPYNDCKAFLHITGVQRLADVEWVFYYKLNSSGFIRDRLFRLPYRRRADSTDFESYRVLLDPNRKNGNIILPEGEVVEMKTTIFVAAAGPQWNDDIVSLSDMIYALPETVSNIKNGIGYLVGITSRTIPYECPD